MLDLRLRTRLIASLAAVTVIATVSGVFGVMSLRGIKTDTASLEEEIENSIANQNKASRRIAEVRNLGNAIISAGDSSDIDNALLQVESFDGSLTELERSDKTLQQSTTTLRELVKERDVLLSSAATLKDVSESVNKELDTIGKAIYTAVKNVKSASSKEISESIAGIRGNVTKSSDKVGASVDTTSSATTDAMTIIRGVLNIRTLSQKLNATVKDGLLTGDPSVVDYKRIQLTTILQNARNELDAMPACDEVETIRAEFSNVDELINTMFAAKKELLAVTQAAPEHGAEDVDEATEEASEDEAATTEDADAETVVADGGDVSPDGDAAGNTGGEEVAEAPDAPTAVLAQALTKTESSLETINEAVQMMADTAEFDATITIDDSLAQIKETLDIANQDTTSKIDNMAEATTSSLGTIDLAYTLQVGCMDMSDGVKGILLANTPAIVKEQHDEIVALLKLANQNLDALPKTKEFSVVTDMLRILEQAVETAAHSRIRWIDAERSCREITGNLNGQLSTLEQDSLRRADELKTLTKESIAATGNDVARSETIQLVLCVVSLIFAVVIAMLLSQAIVRPLNMFVAMLKDVAQGEGDLTKRIKLDRKDEIGEMAQWFNTFVERLQSVIVRIRHAGERLTQSSETLNRASSTMRAGAQSNTEQAEELASAAEKVNRSVIEAESGVSELGSASQEIANSATKAAQVATSAVSDVTQTQESMATLRDASEEIGKIVELINSIAEQTNLLALNATIEAARSGEAGKGFAVVASEVKELASETAHATDEINKKVHAIQSGTASAVTAIAQIREIVGNIEEYQTTIASAVEEQSATTSLLTSTLQGATGATAAIANNTNNVFRSAQESSSSADNAQQNADELTSVAAEMKELLSQFKV